MSTVHVGFYILFKNAKKAYLISTFSFFLLKVLLIYGTRDRNVANLFYSVCVECWSSLCCFSSGVLFILFPAVFQNPSLLPQHAFTRIFLDLSLTIHVPYPDKKAKKIFLIYRKFRRDRVQSHIWGRLPNISGNAQIFDHIWGSR